MAYSKISNRTGEYLAKQLQLSEEQAEIISYGLEKMIFTTLGFLAILAVGWLIQIPLQTFAAVLTGASLRKFSGGNHCSTALRCLITGALIYPAGAWLAGLCFRLYGASAYYLCCMVAIIFVIFLVISRFAPVDSPGKPIISAEFRKQLRYKSQFMVVITGTLSVFLGNSDIGTAIIAGLMLQTGTLLAAKIIRR